MDADVSKQPPFLGFNLVSWNAGSNVHPGPWFDALENIKSLGVHRATMVCYRFLQPATGDITQSSTRGLAPGPSVPLIAAVVEHASTLGFDVGLVPFMEVDNPDGIGRVWRGRIACDQHRLGSFFATYQDYVREVAQIARDTGAARLYIGSELSGLTRDPAAAEYWAELISGVRETLGTGSTCRLGYAAHHDEFESVPFWEDLDDIAVNAYFPLASTGKAKGHSRPRENVLMQGFSRNLRALRRFAGELRRPLTISEWGTVPYDMTSARPWHWRPSDTPDADERSRTYKALLRSIRAEGTWLAACDLWHWRMPGNEASAYGIDHTCDVAGDIQRYVKTGEQHGKI